MFRMAQSIREYVIKQGFDVELTDDAILDIVDEYHLNNANNINESLKRVKLSIGDELVISRLCAIKAVNEYAQEHEIVNDEHLFEFISELIDESINNVFNKHNLEFHISTDDIYDLLFDEQ